MPEDLQPEQLEEWAEKLRRAFDDGASASPPAVVTVDDGLSRYRADELWQEVAYLGYHMHWDLRTLLDLEHRDRRQLIRHVAELNDRAWEEVRTRGR